MHPQSRRVAGAGLLALDVVMYEHGRPEALTFAGGTCGNVLAILKYLQWESSAVGYLGEDEAGSRVLEDLASIGVEATHLVRDSAVSTPVFVQRLQPTDDGPKHSFSNQCPKCGQSYEVTRSKSGASTPIRRFDDAEALDVFFIDRLSDDILALAESAKQRGAMVYYEPSVKSDMDYWQHAFELIDVIKYSSERFTQEEIAPFLAAPKKQAAWEVQTFGAKGLKYRRHAVDTRGAAEWNASPAIAAPRVVDTCGAGDWCSAGLLYGLLSSTKQESDRFEDAVRLGQAMAAWACAFVGARGAMYCNDNPATWTSVSRLLKGQHVDVSEIPVSTTRALLADLCAATACGTASVPARR